MGASRRERERSQARLRPPASVARERRISSQTHKAVPHLDQHRPNSGRPLFHLRLANTTSPEALCALRSLYIITLFCTIDFWDRNARFSRFSPSRPLSATPSVNDLKTRPYLDYRSQKPLLRV